MLFEPSILNLDHTEEISVGVFEDHIIRVRRVPPWMAGCTERDQAVHFAQLIGRVQIQVKPTSPSRTPGWGLIERDAGPLPTRILQNDKAFSGMPNDVVQRCLPELFHALELVAHDYDRADPNIVGFPMRIAHEIIGHDCHCSRAPKFGTAPGQRQGASD